MSIAPFCLIFFPPAKRGGTSFETPNHTPLDKPLSDPIKRRIQGRLLYKPPPGGGVIWPTPANPGSGLPRRGPGIPSPPAESGFLYPSSHLPTCPSWRTALAGNRITPPAVPMLAAALGGCPRLTVLHLTRVCGGGRASWAGNHVPLFTCPWDNRPYSFVCLFAAPSVCCPQVITYFESPESFWTICRVCHTGILPSPSCTYRVTCHLGGGRVGNRNVLTYTA